MKAIILSEDKTRFLRTHDLKELFAQTDCKMPDEMVTILMRLNPHYMVSRYPDMSGTAGYENYNKLIAEEFLNETKKCAHMAPQKHVIQMIHQYLDKLATRLDVQQIVLFGSFARGDQRKESDIDLIVISKDFQTIPFLSLLEMLSIQWPFEKAADIIGYTPKEYKEFATKSTLVRQAQKDGIAAYPKNSE